MKDTRGGERMKFWRKLSPESPNKLYRPLKVLLHRMRRRKKQKKRRNIFTTMKVKKDIKIMRIEELFVFTAK
jgi:hypothetical protein